MPYTLIVSVINDVIIKTLALRPQLTYQWTHGQSVTDIWFFLQAVRFSDVVDIDCSSFFLNLLFFRSWLLKNAQSECDVFYINVQSQNMVSPIRGQLLICSHQWILRSNQFIIKISPIPFSYFHSEANLSTATLQHAEILYPLRAAWHILGVFKYCIGGEYYTRRLWNTKLNR